MHSAYASVADKHARTGDKGFDLLLVLPAERARRAFPLAGTVPAPASASPGRFYDLMHALMAQAKGLCDLAERCARELERTHCPVELGACNVRRLFASMTRASAVLASFSRLGIERHMSTVPDM